jgi:ABC-type phosphate transport system substrate-binding protein
MSLRQQPLARKLGLLVMITVFGCLAFTGVSHAAAPSGGGNNCATDGKITGRGSTLQNNLQQGVWGQGFASDECGPVTTSATGDNSGSTMVAYNYPSAVSNSLTGSGAGITGAECRTDAFNGTDTPYTSAQYGVLQAGGETNSNCSSVNGKLVPPFNPLGTSGNYPASTDNVAATNNVMSFPVAGASVVLAVNLTTGGAGATPLTGCPTTPLSLTGVQVSLLMGGDILNWDDPRLESNGKNAGLATCNHLVTRVVREDNSGTTNIFKNFLIHADNARSTTTQCLGHSGSTEALQTWASYNGSPNTTWPGGTATSTGFQANALDGTCSAATNATTSGGPALFTVLQNTAGSVGYLDLADYENASENPNSVPITAALVQNGAGTTYQPPVSVKLANCNFSSGTLPSGGVSGTVGLNAGDTWANDNATVNGAADHNNLTDTGTAYPICGLTWQLVYAGDDGATGTGPVSELGNDQRQTLYSYVTYELSSVGQAYLSKNYYAPLPTPWLSSLLQGFQGSF